VPPLLNRVSLGRECRLDLIRHDIKRAIIVAKTRCAHGARDNDEEMSAPRFCDGISGEKVFPLSSCSLYRTTDVLAELSGQSFYLTKDSKGQLIFPECHVVLVRFPKAERWLGSSKSLRTTPLLYEILLCQAIYRRISSAEISRIGEEIFDVVEFHSVLEKITN
jgi:hypothetical protein